MTAHASREEGERCLAEGMNAHLTKPIDLDALQQCLQRWCGVRRQGTESPTEAAAPETLPHPLIDGLDQEQGLRLCAGKRALYTSLLHQFCGTLGGVHAEIRAALAAGQVVQAARLAHTVRGVAANIGAFRCREVAAELETLLERDPPTSGVEVQVLALERELTHLIASIVRHYPQPEATLAAPDPALTDWEQWGPIGQELLQLLEASDALSASFAEEHAELLQAGLGPAFAALQAQIQRFDLAAAHENLGFALKARSPAAGLVDAGARKSSR